jgi:MFS family permease
MRARTSIPPLALATAFLFQVSYELLPTAVQDQLVTAFGLSTDCDRGTLVAELVTTSVQSMPSVVRDCIPPELLSSIVFVSMALLAIPAGGLTDRHETRRVLVLSATVVMLAMIWSSYAAFTTNLQAFMISRLVGGVGIVFTLLAGLKETDAHGEEWDTVWNISPSDVFLSAIPGGIGLALLIGPVLAGIIDWRLTFPIYGMFSFVFLGLYLLSSGHTEASENESRVAVREVVMDGALWKLAGAGFAASGIVFLISIMMPNFLDDAYPALENSSLPVSKFFTAGFALIGIAGRVVTTKLSNERFKKQRRPLAARAWILSTAGVLVFLWASFSFVPLPIVLLCLFVAGFTIQVGLTILYTYVADLMDSTEVATGHGVLNMLALGGAFSVPFIAGVVRVILKWGYQGAFGLGVGLAFVGTGLVVAVREPNP